jgi:hypothetical protein
MEKIRELLGRLTTLTVDELTELREAIVAEADRVDGEATTPENVAILNELADMGDQVMSESEGREAAQAQAETDKEATRARIAKLKGEAPEEEEGAEETEAEGESEEDAAAKAEEEAAAAAEEEAGEGAEVAVTATGAVARMAAVQGKPKPSPEAGNPRGNTRVLLAAGYQAGREITDKIELARAIGDQLDCMDRRASSNGKVIVASARTEYPEDRRLQGSNAELNTQIMERVAGQRAPRYDRRTGALVATGGICQPVNVDYAVPTWATADRPLKDGLPAYEATRGGVRFVQPPDLQEWESATGIWTEATDAEPGSATKPIKALACGTEETVYVEAVSTRIGFGNMQSRFAPEQVAANTDLAVAAGARVAEVNLLKLIAEKCVVDVTNTQLLGATRDLLTTIYQVAAAYRWRHRLPKTQALSAILPEWLKDLMKVDLLREIGHAQTSTLDVLNVQDEYVDGLIENAGVRPIWHIDGQPEDDGVYPQQGWGAQSASSVVQPFPTKVVWYFFVEGTIQFLDAGRLDLGVVRDSTLDATNDYETFVETFEGIAYRGFANGAYQLVTELCANGGTAGTISTAGKCA